VRIRVERIALGECALGEMHTDFGTGGCVIVGFVMIIISSEN